MLGFLPVFVLVVAVGVAVVAVVSVVAVIVIDDVVVVALTGLQVPLYSIEHAQTYKHTQTHKHTETRTRTRCIAIAFAEHQLLAFWTFL